MYTVQASREDFPEKCSFLDRVPRCIESETKKIDQRENDDDCLCISITSLECARERCVCSLLAKAYRVYLILTHSTQTEYCDVEH